MKLRNFLLILLFLFPSVLNAQSLKDRIEVFIEKRQEKIALTDKYQISGPVLSYGSLQDQRISPLIYPGPGAGIYWTTFKISPKWTTIHDLRLQYNHLQGPSTLNSQFRSPQGRLESSFLRHIRSDSWAAGGGISGEYTANFYDKLENDSFHGDGVVSLNAVASYTEEFPLLKREAWFRSSLIVPVFSYINRFPDYNIGGMEHILAGPGSYRRLGLKAELVKLMKHSKENRVSISYEWDFWHLTNEDEGLPVRTANHRLRIGFWLKRM
ncbi:MAG: hypothetical protein ACOCUP_01030 [bacterium]